jgi:CubicO group peptidase (beta-lactamase class C family)
MDRRRFLAGWLAAGAADAAEEYFPPPDSKGGWRTPSSETEAARLTGMDREKLDEAFAYIQGSTKHGGLAVVRNGWLVYERYFGLGGREATPNTASCGKSFTSIAMGVLLGENPEWFPDGLDQKVFTPRYLPAEAFPLSDPRKASIRLGHLLAMTAGIRGNNPSYVRGKPVSIDPVGPDGWPACVDAAAFGKTNDERNTAALWTEPGGGYSYATSSIHLVSVMLRHLTGVGLEKLVEERLAQPLGWGRWGWGYRQAGLPHVCGGGGIALRATDMARFGYLLLRRGRWEKRQIAPEWYVRQCGHRTRFNPHYPYSFQFEVNEGGQVAGAPRDAFWKTGSGGHALYVVPSLDLVVWKMGGRDEQYNSANTGLPPSPANEDAVAARTGWSRNAEDAAAARRTLEMVTGSIARRSL